MKKLFLLLSIFLISAVAYAQKEKALSLSMHDGTSVSFFLKNKPLVTFDGDYMEIVAETSQVKVKRSDVAEIKFLDEEDNTGIDETTVSETIGIGNEYVFVGDLQVGCSVRVLSVDGRLVIDEAADENGSVTISLSALPAGIYILNYNNTTIKFIRP